MMVRCRAVYKGSVLVKRCIRATNALSRGIAKFILASLATSGDLFKIIGVPGKSVRSLSGVGNAAEP